MKFSATIRNWISCNCYFNFKSFLMGLILPNCRYFKILPQSSIKCFENWQSKNVGYSCTSWCDNILEDSRDIWYFCDFNFVFNQLHFDILGSHETQFLLIKISTYGSFIFCIPLFCLDSGKGRFIYSGEEDDIWYFDISMKRKTLAKIAHQLRIMWRS